MPQDEGSADEPTTASERQAAPTQRVAEAGHTKVEAVDDADDEAQAPDKTDMNAVGDDGQVFGG